MKNKKVIVKQTRSLLRTTERQRNTIQALGLGKIGRQIEHNLTQDIIGMLETVSHLVSVRPVA